MNDFIEIFNEDRSSYIIFILTILVGVIGFFIRKAFKKNNGDSSIVKDNSIKAGDGSTSTIIKDSNIHIGISPEQYADGLRNTEKRIRDELGQAHSRDRHALEAELSAIQEKLRNEKTSYETYITSLKERIAQLDKLRGEIPNTLLDKAIEALKQNKKVEADSLFKQVEEDYDETVKLIAEASYQRGKIAEDSIQYLDALNHFEKATRLSPDNALYLNQAGLINDKLAFHKKAIDYYERALASNLKTYGEDHPEVATNRNNLGGTWHDLGEYQKAVDYYELALASDLKTYGEDHPDVALDRNNLGGTWQALGEYQKAIDYFELALASDLKTYGEDHHDVAIDRNNLGSAWQTLGEYQKAIDYFELALASDLKIYGEDHPDVALDRNNLGGTWQALGEYQKAIDYYELALTSDLKIYGEDHPKVAIRRNNLGRFLAKSG